MNERIGEETKNNFGSKMKIIAYRKYNDVDVYFEEYNWIAKNRQYIDFQKGEIKCPYERRVYNVGFIGEGKYKPNINRKNTECYTVWQHMIRRCYDNKIHKKRPTYIDCKVCDEWLNFQNFAEWYYNNYYEVEGEQMCLDKDILYKGNKIYSPETCVFTPNGINVLFTKSNKARGKYPIGVSKEKTTGKFKAECQKQLCEKSESRYLGLYDTPKEAFEVYKIEKEKYIKYVADKYKDKIPENLYNALYKYEVEIND